MWRILSFGKTAACIYCVSVQLYYLRITGVVLPLLSISRTPLSDGELESVPMVSVLERVTVHYKYNI